MPTVAKSVQEQWHIRTLTYRLADAIVIIVGWLLATASLAPTADQNYALAMTVTILVFHFVGEITGMYRNWRGVTVDKEVMCAFLTWLITLPILVTIVVLIGIPAIEIAFLRDWLLLTLACMAITRIGLRGIQVFLRRRGLNTRGYAIVGVSELAFQLAANIEKTPEMGLKLKGFFDDRNETRTPAIDSRVGQCVGNLNELVAQARSGAISMIYITFPMRAEDRIRVVLESLADSTASVYLVPDFFVFELLHSRWTDIGGLPAVSVFENPFYGVDGIVKRFIDVLLASALLLVLAIPMLFIAALVKKSSP